MASDQILPAGAFTGWYRSPKVVRVAVRVRPQKNQCLWALVRVVHLESPLGIPHTFCHRQVVPPPALPRVATQPIRTFPKPSETIRGYPNPSEVNYFFSAARPFIAISDELSYSPIAVVLWSPNQLNLVKPV